MLADLVDRRARLLGRVLRRLIEPFDHPDRGQGLADARRLAPELDKSFPDAAGKASVMTQPISTEPG